MRRLISWFRSLPRPRQVLVALGALLVLVVLLGALTLATVPFAAQKAKTEAEAATQSLQQGDLDSAADHAASAGRWGSWSAFAANWWGGDLWSLVPVLGGAVDDAQHLTGAVDALTDALGTGMDVAPEVMGDDPTVVRGGSVDLEGLQEVLAAVDEAGADLVSARESLHRVEGAAPLAGGTIAAARTEALRIVDPAVETFVDVQPLLDRLPDLLGADGRKHYLLALMNPSEQRFSGGGTLSFKTLTLEDGSIVDGVATNTMEEKGFLRKIRWPAVPGNPFHVEKDRYRLLTATLAPSWPVSGAELARAWHKVRGVEIDGVVAIDVIAVQRLMTITGPIESQGFGTLTAQNLTERLVGSYDELTGVDVYSQRKWGEQQLMRTFQNRLLKGGKKSQVVRILDHAADGGHFALWFADDAAQAGIAALDLAGELSDTEHDYIGVFNQSRRGYKSDFWQRRAVTSQVELREDGSAHVKQTVRIHNDSPPETNTASRLYWFYTRRENDMMLGSFLPVGADVSSVRLEGRPVRTPTEDYYGRPFVRVPVFLDDQQTKTVTIEYDVPNAAEVVDGGLVYRLDVDPHALVIPQTLDVQVTLPEGYAASALPQGWQRLDDGRLRRTVPKLDSTYSWAIPLQRTDAAS